MSEVACIPYSLGFTTLGGLVQPLIAADEPLPLERSIQGITYRPEQPGGLVQLVAFPKGHPDKAVNLFQAAIKTKGRHPGSVRYTVTVKARETGEIELTVLEVDTSAGLLSHTFKTPSDLNGLEPVDCPESEELQGRLLAVHAEVMMRWFRGLLREREVRVGTRDIVYETRDATTALERAIDEGDAEILRKQIGVLRHYGDEVCRRTQCTSFPAEIPIVFFPESA